MSLITLDKIGILELKAERFDDPVKAGHVRAELAPLIEARDRSIFIHKTGSRTWPPS